MMADGSDMKSLALEVLALDEKATPGPWTVLKEHGLWHDGTCMYSTEWRANHPELNPGLAALCWSAEEDEPTCRDVTFRGGENDEAFIALARTAAPALAREVLRQAWHPIETAPLGGVGIIVSCSGTVGEAHFDDGDEHWYWANLDSSDYHATPIYPEFWQPLPEPPTAEETEGLKSGRE